MTILGANGDIDSRVNDLIERGLAAYGAGDLHGAMSFWKLALALDDECHQAADYVTYVKRHFHLVDEVPAVNACSEPDVELDIPFGLVTLEPTTQIDFDSYDSFELAMPSGLSAPTDGVEDDFGEEQVTRIASASQPSEIDEGWSLEGTGEFDVSAYNLPPRKREPAPRLTYEMSQLSDVELGGLADVLEPESEDPLDDTTTQPLDPVDELEDQLAAVTEGLMIAESGAIERAESEAIELELVAEEPESIELVAQEPESIELVAEEPESIELVAEEPEPIAPYTPPPAQVSAAARSTAFGYKPTIKPHSSTLLGLPETPAKRAKPGGTAKFSKGSRPPTQPRSLPERPPTPVPSLVAPGERAESQPYGEPLELELELPADPPPVMIGDVELELDDSNTSRTADIDAPPELGDVGQHLDALSFEQAAQAPTERGRAQRRAEWDVAPLAQELGPVPDVEATPMPMEPVGAPLELDLELGKAGTSPPPADVQISFRTPGTPAPTPAPTDDIPLGFDQGPSFDDDDEISVTVEGAPLEDQLAELEMEMRTSGGAVEWRTHDSGVEVSAPIAPVAPIAPPTLDDRGGDDFEHRQPTIQPESATIAAEIAASVERGAAHGESREDQIRRRIFGFIDRADVECRRERYSIAVVAADLALSEDPDSAIAQKLIHQSHALLIEVFRRYLGNLEGTPAVALPMHEISLQELDHRTAFLLSRIDGSLTFEDILDVSGMPRLEALRYLCRLRLQGILEVR